MIFKQIFIFIVALFIKINKLIFHNVRKTPQS